MFKNSKAAALIATTLAVLAGAVAGCGSSGDSASTTSASTPPVTQPGDGNAAFVADVEAICIDVNRKIGRLGTPRNDRQLAAISARAVALVGDAARQMRAVDPPEDLAADYDRFVALVEEQGDAFDDVREQTLAGDIEAVRQALARSDEANREQDLIADNIGLRACAASIEEREEPAPGGGAPLAPATPAPFGGGAAMPPGGSS
jgi:hypothetical protein